jgi:hypothetical protein
MLINKGFSSGDVVSIKLINGDEIISRFESEDADTVTINRPLALTMSGQGLGMIPWAFLGDDAKIVLDKKNTFFIVASKKEAANQYLEGTTGIALVK